MEIRPSRQRRWSHEPRPHLLPGVILNLARLWTEVSSDQKQRLQKVLFSERVIFSAGEFGTAVKPLIIKLLEKPEGAKSSLATLPGLEPVLGHV